MSTKRIPTARCCLAAHLGLVGYREAMALQACAAGEVAAGTRPPTLLLLEHPNVFTLGRRGRRSDILIGPDELRRLGVEVHEADRGGEVTYHGPGQLVGYPILDLRDGPGRPGGPRAYVRALQRALVATLAEFGVAAYSDGAPTGVWAGAAKIASIGVRVSRGVTTHGFALNVDPDLSYFGHIVPCGMPGAPVTSVFCETGQRVRVQDAAVVAARWLGHELGLEVSWVGENAA